MPQSTCTIDACEKEAKAPRGWCWKHYGLWRRHGDPLWVFVQAPCSVDHCERSSRVSGMCDMHYRRMKIHGDTRKGRPVYGPTCLADACDADSRTAGLCSKHYFIRWTTEGRGHGVNAASRAARRARMANSPVVERGLSWRSLWAEGLRDCYLCGIACDPEDFRTAINRGGWEQHICGPTHPSLDHVQALANGGAHARANVALACSQCNSRKHSKVGYEAELVATGQAARADS